MPDGETDPTPRQAAASGDDGDPDHAAQHRSDQALRTLLTFALGGVGVAILATWLTPHQRWIWFALAALLAAAVIATAPGGLLTSTRYGATLLGRLLAALALAGYLIGAWMMTAHQSILLSLAVVTCLWTVAVLLTWRSLTTTRTADDAALGVAFLLAGVAALLLGVARLREGQHLAGVAFLLAGVAFLLLGAARLRDARKESPDAPPTVPLPQRVWARLIRRDD